jgi:regulator of replication initiation timing
MGIAKGTADTAVSQWADLHPRYPVDPRGMGGSEKRHPRANYVEDFWGDNAMTPRIADIIAAIRERAKCKLPWAVYRRGWDEELANEVEHRVAEITALRKQFGDLINKNIQLANEVVRLRTENEAFAAQIGTDTRMLAKLEIEAVKAETDLPEAFNAGWDAARHLYPQTGGKR